MDVWQMDENTLQRPSWETNVFSLLAAASDAAVKDGMTVSDACFHLARMMRATLDKKEDPLVSQTNPNLSES